MATYAEVAHAWAHQSRRVKRADRLYYEGLTIYSYGRHYPLARLCESEPGAVGSYVETGRVAGVYVLLASERWSVSTSNHSRVVASAVRHLPVYRVPDVLAYTAQGHERNIADMLCAASRAVDRAASRRRAAYAASDMDHAERLRESAAGYAAACGLGADYVPTTLDSVRGWTAHHLARIAVHWRRRRG